MTAPNTFSVHDLCCEDFKLAQEYGNFKVTITDTRVRVNRSRINFCPFCAMPIRVAEVTRNDTDT